MVNPSSWKTPAFSPLEIAAKVGLSRSGMSSKEIPEDSSIIRTAEAVRSPSRSSLRKPSCSMSFLP
jgi:hypothetical protein